jgi:hypothetical protein
MMRDPIEPPDGVDPRQGIGGRQLSRRDDGKGRGAMVPLQRLEFPGRALPVSESGGNLG